MNSTAVLTSLSLLLAGCSSDTSLRVAPELPIEPVDQPRAGAGRTAVDAEQRPASPWDGLDPGDMPDDLFAIAWIDFTVDCINCTYGPTVPSRYDLVDVRGQVVSSFALPFVWGDWTWAGPELLGIEASGPGRFLVRNQIWHQDSIEQIVWEADGNTGVGTVLARLREGVIELPLAGVSHPLPLDAWSRDEVVLPDPTDAERLLIVPTSSSPYLPSDFRAIWSVSVTDPESPVRSWSIHELLPPELLPEAWDVIMSPWSVALAEDGSGQVVLGVTGWETLPTPDGDKRTLYAARPILLGFDLDDPAGTRWVEDAAAIGVTDTPPRVVPPTDDRSAMVLFTAQWCDDRLRAWQDGLTMEVMVPIEDQCPVAGPVLDAPSRTFVYLASAYDQDNYGQQRIVVSVAGEEVWSIDRLRVGLSERPFAAMGFARVER